jgi:hypothetical protein
MSATPHHEFHPDAESLNAFAEQALGERERAETLAHLAACSRCRRVVALARGAADEDAGTDRVPAATGRAATAPRAWWRNWWLAAAPVAALAATAALAVYVHLHHAERAAEVAKIEPESQAPNAGSVPAPSPPTRENNPEPAPTQKPLARPMSPARPAASPGRAEQATRANEQPRSTVTESYERENRRAHSAVDERPPSEPSGTPEAAQRPPEGVHGMAFAFRQPPPPAPMAPPQADGEEARKAEPQADSKASPPSYVVEEQEQAEQKQDAEQTRKRAFAARAAAPGVSGGAAPSTAQSVTVAATAAPEVQPAPLPQWVAVPEAEIARNGSNSAKAIHLPSGLAAASIAVAGHRMLAIDDAGALFLSDDQGKIWEHVAPQWTGRAVQVRRRDAPNGALQFAPGAQPAPAGNTPSEAAPAQPPAIFFELLNDKNQMWLSTDGRIWIAQ